MFILFYLNILIFKTRNLQHMIWIHAILNILNNLFCDFLFRGFFNLFVNIYTKWYLILIWIWFYKKILVIIFIPFFNFQYNCSLEYCTVSSTTMSSRSLPLLFEQASLPPSPFPPFYAYAKTKKNPLIHQKRNCRGYSVFQEKSKPKMFFSNYQEKIKKLSRTRSVCRADYVSTHYTIL